MQEQERNGKAVLLRWVVGIMSTMLAVGLVFYLNFVAKAVDDIRSDIGAIKLDVKALQIGGLTRRDVLELIDSRVPWPKDRGLVLQRIARLEKRMDRVEADRRYPVIQSNEE